MLLALGLVLLPAANWTVAALAPVEWLSRLRVQTKYSHHFSRMRPSSSHRLCDCWSVYPLAHDPLFHKVGSLAHCDCCPVDGVGVISRRATTAESLK